MNIIGNIWKTDDSEVDNVLAIKIRKYCKNEQRSQYDDLMGKVEIIQGNSIIPCSSEREIFFQSKLERIKN